MNLPAAAKVAVDSAPGSWTPLLKSMSLIRMLCFTPSSFLKVTLSPTATFSSFMPKDLSFCETVWPVAAAAATQPIAAKT